MAMVIRVRFKRAGKLYDFDPAGLDLHNGMHVVTETARGVELGECMSGVMEIPDERVTAPLKPILRIATEQDELIQKRNEEYEKEAFDIALERIAEHGLEMKLVDVEYAFDHSKIIFYFTANGRVDFRMLVKNLAGIFKTRIELRQIGVRDEAKMLGGIGPCGRPICCRTFLGDFTPVSIKMAKEQNLSLNPTKISGLCDRLMCCLKYEQDQYEATRKRMPRVGREIITPDGVGTINAINVLEETVRVRIAVGDTFELREYRIDDCQRPEPQNPPAGERQDRGQEKGEKPERAERPPRTEKPERAEKPERRDRPEKAERRDKGDRPRKRGEQMEGEKPERTERPPRAERPERGERPGKRGDKPQRMQNPKLQESREADAPKQPTQETEALVQAQVLEIVESGAVEDLL
ncbi:MAG: regulatory iron-sulfur-containing complex subunit RicT [Christensenellales bacterium]|nr:regulatory iron-sulfur-containing complex subunit RicT [Christensenellales bacterium]